MPPPPRRAPGSRPPAQEFSDRRRTVAAVASCAFLAIAIGAFTRSWTQGSLVLDGPGVSLFTRLALDHWQGLGVPYWISDMWSGAPVWALAPYFPVVFLVPLASVFGPESAVQLSSVGAQVVGAWGAFVLARSLWKRIPAAALAGLVYGLHPLFASHALFGHETSLWVMAATPWLVWSLRLALRGEGARYVALAGLIVGFAILQQAEHVYVLAILCGSLLAVELARARLNPAGPRGVSGTLFRAAVVVAIGLGVVAHWLVPFITNHESFVLTTPDSVRAVLVEGIAGDLGKEMGLFLNRAAEANGAVGFDRDLLAGNFYLSWVALLLTGLTIAQLGRHDDDGSLTAVLFTSAVGVWMSTAAVPLASSGPAARRQLLPFIVIGALAGLLVGSFIRRLRLGRVAAVGGVLTAVLLVALPYFAPFVALQQVIPFLATLRFPRFYHVAALGMALGAAFPLTLLQRWAEERRPRLAPLLSLAVALGVAGVFLVDAGPYRSYYRVRAPDREAAYQRADEELDAGGSNQRVAVSSFGDPAAVEHMLRTGRHLSTGWPHAVAGREIWRLSGESFFGPPGYRDAALGLSGTSHVAEELYVRSEEQSTDVAEVRLVPNPNVLPIVRAYDQVVVVEDADLAPVLAAPLAQRNVGVVTGDPDLARQLGPQARSVVPSDDPCSTEVIGAVEGDVAGEVAMACALDRWVGVFVGARNVGVKDRPGAVFESPVNGLQGVSVWLDRSAHPVELTLWELEADGRTLGREVAHGFPGGFDQNGLAAFSFDPVSDSAGKRYAFELSCPVCGPDEEHNLLVASADRAPANLLRNRNRVGNRVADFSLLYPRVPVASASPTSLKANRTGAGRWRVETSGENPAVVVVAEAWFPGWTAQVDGREAPVLKADGAFLGVAVGPGDHEITLAYDVPSAVTLGRAITALTLLAAGFLLLAPRRRPGQPGVTGRLQRKGPEPPKLPAFEPEPAPEPSRPRPAVAAEPPRRPRRPPPPRRLPRPEPPAPPEVDPLEMFESFPPSLADAHPAAEQLDFEAWHRPRAAPEEFAEPAEAEPPRVPGELGDPAGSGEPCVPAELGDPVGSGEPGVPRVPGELGDPAGPAEPGEAGELDETSEPTDGADLSAPAAPATASQVDQPGPGPPVKKTPRPRKAPAKASGRKAAARSRAAKPGKGTPARNAASTAGAAGKAARAGAAGKAASAGAAGKEGIVRDRKVTAEPKAAAARKGGSSGTAGDALQVGAPAGRPARKAVLGAAQPQPRPAAGARKRPRGKGQKAVLPAIDDLQTGVRDQPKKRGGRKPGADRHTVPLRMKPATGPDDRVVLDRLRQDQMTSGPKYPADLGQDQDGVVEVVQYVDAPHQTDSGVTEW